MKLFNMIIVVVLLLLLPLSIAYTTTEITAPSALFETQSSTSVNVSGGINSSNSLFPNIGASSWSVTTNNTNMWVNVTIMNKSCQSCAYGAHSSHDIKVSNSTNNSFWNQTITLAAGYNWIYLNFTNVSRLDNGAYRGSSTAARIINVDPDMYLLNIGGFGTFNISLDTGDMVTMGCIRYNCTVVGTGSGCITLGTCS